MAAITWDDLPYELQEKIVFTSAIGGVEQSKTAMMLHKSTSNVCKSQEYYKQVNLERLPRFAWKSPNSSEQEFMLECYFAGNPDIFYRLLLADIFEHGRYSQLQYLLNQMFSGGHPQATYMSFLLKLMGPTQEMRKEGFNEMIAVYNSNGGNSKILKSRWMLCWHTNRIYQGFRNFRLDVPRYCTHHSIPTFGERHFIDCNNCKADFETRIHMRNARYHDVLFQGYADIMDSPGNSG